MMKRPVLARLLVAVSVLASPLLSNQPAFACACCETYSVHRVESWDVLNVRSGPGAKYSIVNTLRHDEGCIVLTGERRGKWVYVLANESGAEGWVHSRYLRFRAGISD